MSPYKLLIKPFYLAFVINYLFRLKKQGYYSLDTNDLFIFLFFYLFLTIVILRNVYPVTYFSLDLTKYSIQGGYVKEFFCFF
jgi:hypothetical protein